MMFVFPSEISNLLVMTTNREPAPQRQNQVSQLSFHRILKEEIEQVIFIYLFKKKNFFMDFEPMSTLL